MIVKKCYSVGIACSYIIYNNIYIYINYSIIYRSGIIRISYTPCLEVNTLLIAYCVYVTVCVYEVCVQVYDCAHNLGMCLAQKV